MINNDAGFTIEFEDGSEHFYVEGDCCSHSWIEHFSVPNDLEGATILEVTELHLGAEDNVDGHEYLQSYETCFRTNRGDITLEYRNSSNGYYGGYLVWENNRYH